MIELLKKYKSIISYLVFGVLTTLVNIVTYALCYKVFEISNVTSTIIAWLLAVLFAFVTNKLWVFDSKTADYKIVLYQIITFLGCRLATGFIDLGIMYVSVDLLLLNALIMKVLSNGLVIFLNYIASKLIIFKKMGEEVNE